MATRKALVLVSGLFQELNSSADKLDFAGNSTSDLSEGTNQYFTNARSRSSISVTDAGGLGSATYNNSNGEITYTGPSNSDVRGLVSVASGSGLTYDNSTGEFGTNAIPNAKLANSSITLGSATVNLGDTVSGLSLTNIQAITKLQVGAEGGAGNIILQSSGITFEGSSGGADTNETLLAVTDPTSDRTITLPDATGTVALTSDISYPVTLTNSVTLTNKTLALGSNTISGTLSQFNTAVTDATLVSTTGAETLTNKSLTAPVLTGSSTSAGSIIFKEDTDNGTNSATLKGPASTADVTITLPAETGTVLTTASSIANSNLANSTVTIGNSAVALGSSVTTLTGVTSLSVTGNINLPDNDKVIFGTGSDLQIFHDSANSYIKDNGTGQLRLQTNELLVINTALDENILKASADGSVELYHDNVKRIETQSYGASVTGAFVASNSIKMSSYAGKLQVGVNNELQLSHDDTDSFIENAAGNLHIRPKTGEEGIKLIPDGAVELYHDNVKKVETTSSGITVTGTVNGKDIATLTTEDFATAIAVALG